METASVQYLPIPADQVTTNNVTGYLVESMFDLSKQVSVYTTCFIHISIGAFSSTQLRKNKGKKKDTIQIM